MNMESILCYNAGVWVIAVDLCRASPVKCADRDKNDWQYQFQGPSTAERSHLQRCREDRRAVPIPSPCVSLIKTNERASWLILCRWRESDRRAWLSHYRRVRLPLAPIGHRCHKTIMSWFRGITVLLNTIASPPSAQIWYVPQRPFNVPMFNKRAGHSSLSLSLPPLPPSLSPSARFNKISEYELSRVKQRPEFIVPNYNVHDELSTLST